ncbi:formylmethanofuran dehydrogenase subunit C [Caldimonas tepidiphila]|uniref:formylmethanofuran dehydrogenase subunit C n=1 Tax=Caldimonas tepidiphila TaxID=2315841 RepID=UPI001F0CBC66|nr:formylmethanofuran dehydrogenase subunit C [Caldimonas tepidiphila]
MLIMKQAPALRVDLRAVQPARLAGMPAGEIERLAVPCGREMVPLAEFCRVVAGGEDTGTLVLDGDFSRFDRIGWQLAGGRIEVRGAAGDHVGTGMSAGEIRVHGDAGMYAGCEMAGGRLEVAGSVGDFAAGALPGSMDGMRGGLLLVRGHAGERFGDRMRRGTAAVLGDAGDFLGSRMVAGTIAVAGRVGAHCAWGMRRGSIVCAGSVPPISPTFAETGANFEVAWQLIARDLARLGGPFESLPRRRLRRHAGDLAVGGRGELLLPA